MEQETTCLNITKLGRRKMNFRRKLVIAVPVALIIALVIALVAIPAGAINRSPVLPDNGTVYNSPGPVPTILNYQGYLTDSNGDPVNDTLEMTFSIYETSEGGVPVWAETQPSVVVTDGLFNVLLGSVNPIYAIHLTGESYLGVQVGSDPEMTPRQRIGSAAYAHESAVANFARNADSLDDMDSEDFVAVAGDTMTEQLVLPADGLVAGADQLVLADGKVGIGTDSPIYKLDVHGGSNNGINVSGDATGVYASGNFAGVHGESINGAGVRGWSDNGEGVEGKNSNSNNRGLLGASGAGVYGIHDDSGNYGQLGNSVAGVYGIGQDYANGVFGRSERSFGMYAVSINGTAVEARHNNSGNTGQLGTAIYGVHGISYIDTGTGVYGVNIAAGEGVYGRSLGGTGVYGEGITWDFYAHSNNYGPFTGAHEVKLAADFPQDFRQGLIVAVTGETQVRTDEGEINYSSTLPTVQLSDKANDRAVFGVIVSESPLPEKHWYEANEGERFGIVNALGEGRVLVTNFNGDIGAGDYITTSAIAGYGQKQDDDLLHSYTLGKAIETVDWSQVSDTIEFNGQTCKVYAIAVVYTSG
jgi:hypothetical protein